MASERWLPSAGRIVVVAILASLALAPSAHALRIVNYNLLNYPGTSAAVRNPHFQTILAPLGADVVVAQEMQSQVGVDTFRDGVLNVLEPGQWASAPFVNGNDTDNALFYKPSQVELVGQWAWYPNPANLLRLVNCYRLRPVGRTNVEFRVYSQHLKASNTSSDAAQRLAEATGIRDSMNAVPPGTHCILMGDFNIYSGAEAAFLKLKEVQADNDGRLYDPLNAPASTWNTPSLAAIHTQSPCNGTGCASGAATGAMDDRFDMFLPTFNLGDGEGLDLVPGTYIPVGNDGLHYNLGMNQAPVIPEGAAYGSALTAASDHIPIRVDLQLPALAQIAGSLPFGSVLVGATASQALTVANAAAVPADELTYAYAPPAGFSAPAGPLSAPVGAPSIDAIGMDTASPGARAGTLVVTTDDPDHPVVNVALSGTVLDHAQASLDSLAALLSGTLDFGDHGAAGFADQPVRVHNRGYDALRARLAVSAAAITGPDAARFSIAGGFTPALIAGTAATWTVHFDDAGAPADSTYQATLTLTGADEALPGAAAQPALLVGLRARLVGAVDAPQGPLAPLATRLYAPFPNPLAGESTVRFDLARAGETRLDVFDLSGRRVARLLAGSLEPGRYSARWGGRSDEGSTLGAGLYFVRLTAPGLAPQTARLAIVH
jgi:endonuclease/exonuclease/phosphatase family metal-dependent hydrolase